MSGSTVQTTYRCTEYNLAAPLEILGEKLGRFRSKNRENPQYIQLATKYNVLTHGFHAGVALIVSAVALVVLAKVSAAILVGVAGLFLASECQNRADDLTVSYRCGRIQDFTRQYPILQERGWTPCRFAIDFADNIIEIWKNYLPLPKSEK